MTQIDYATCKDCGLCAKVCAAKIIREEDGHFKPIPYPDWGCFRCGLCMAVCPTKSIHVEGMDYADFVPLKKGGPDFDSLYASLMGRRSIRDYKEAPVDREALTAVVNAAATAPMGAPPTDVEILVLDRRKDIDEIIPELMREYRMFLIMMKIPPVRWVMRILYGGPMYHALLTHVVPAARTVVERSEEGRDYFTYNAPALMIFHGDRYKVAIRDDSYIAASYASIAALTVGLGCCFSGMVPPILDRSKKIKTMLGIPRDNGVYACLMIGRPAVKFVRAVPRTFKGVEFSSERGA
jgi:ferredoxin